MRLLYLYVYENDLFKDLAINFTNDYEICFEDVNKSEIVIKKKDDSPNVAEQIYSRHIQSVTALVGINGVGKTTLLDYLGVADDETEHFYEEATYFILYEMNECLFIECKEGKKKLEFIHMDDCLEWEYTNRHWWAVKYLEKEKKLVTVYDAKWDYEYQEIRMYEESIMFYYYKDYTANIMEWTKPYTYYETLFSQDGHSDLQRKKVYNSLYGIYRFFSTKGRMLEEILDRRKEIECVVRLREEHIYLPWRYVSEEAPKQSFVLQYLVSILMTRVENKEELKEWIEEIFRNEQSKSNKKKYRNIKGMLLDKLEITNNIMIEEIKNIIIILEKMQVSFFRQPKGLYLQRGMIAAKEIYFNTLDEFDASLYEALFLVSKVNKVYNAVEYEYEAMSAGEAKCIDVFAGLYSFIGNEDSLRGKNIVVLLDEPDKGMHPEFARNLMKVIDDFSDEIGKNMDCTFQYVFATHSPFLTLDIPSNWVYRLEKIEDKTSVMSDNVGVLTNVVDLIKDTFYLQSAFGVLSEGYFKKLQNDIINISKNCSMDEIKILQSRIDMINEPSLKRYLTVKLEQKLAMFYSKKDLLQYYQDKIKELEGND